MAPDFATRPETFVPRSDIVAPLEAIQCTERLSLRPKRAPDYEAENRALTALIQALADSPSTILQRLADVLLEVFRADSVGISLLTTDGKSFYWPAIAGAWRPHLVGGTPRDFGPCRDVLDRNAPLLFTHWERRYPYLLEVVPLAEEGLLVPIYVRGKAVGTIWAIAHDLRRQFDSEDLRQLESFGRFASAACQAVEILRSEQSLEAIINRTPFMLTRCGQDLRYRFVSSSYAQMVGLQPTEINGKSLSDVIGEEGLQTILPYIKRALQGERVEYENEVHYRGAGRRFLRVVYMPEKNDDGKVESWLGSIIDISEQKRRAEAEKMLVRELQHRSNNLLSVIQAIAQKSLSGDRSLDDARTAFEARLLALARANRHLTKSNWEGVSLEEIVRSTLEAFAARIDSDGINVMLGAKDAQSLSLALHELWTNAVKHGALSSAQGRVRIKWNTIKSGTEIILRLQWRERGGPTVVPPKRQGFGTTLLNAVFDRLHLEYAPEGLTGNFELQLQRINASTWNFPVAIDS
jgi:PAS domain S-box-containing protein